MIANKIASIRESVWKRQKELLQSLSQSEPKAIKDTISLDHFSVNLDQQIFYKPSGFKNAKNCRCCQNDLKKVKIKSCELCGQNVCQKCISKNRNNPENESKSVRVCRVCQQEHLKILAFQKEIVNQIAMHSAIKKLLSEQKQMKEEVTSKIREKERLKKKAMELSGNVANKVKSSELDNMINRRQVELKENQTIIISKQTQLRDLVKQIAKIQVAIRDQKELKRKEQQEQIEREQERERKKVQKQLRNEQILRKKAIKQEQDRVQLQRKLEEDKRAKQEKELNRYSQIVNEPLPDQINHPVLIFGADQPQASQEEEDQTVRTSNTHYQINESVKVQTEECLQSPKKENEGCYCRIV